ncbi:hypothetical protein EDC01DRAFT_247740 [Geopyxis carbonaria]|nr:hypothetical protein EDC01DRAFT_247740 [Geopyxis carbonaria]
MNTRTIHVCLCLFSLLYSVGWATSIVSGVVFYFTNKSGSYYGTHKFNFFLTITVNKLCNCDRNANCQSSSMMRVGHLILHISLGQNLYIARPLRRRLIILRYRCRAPPAAQPYRDVYTSR